ncbi:MAG: WhiB family transcriptional regulator [Pseudonocardia sp.]
MSPRTTARTAAAPGRVGDWRELARCREVDDGDLFFPEAARAAGYEAQVAAAKRICAGCAVRPDCLAYALRALPYGIAGGLTPEERRELRGRSGTRIAELTEAARTATTRRQRAAAGRALLDAGRPAAEVARVCGVSVATARRWAVLARTQITEVSA